jgi:hypothetical protein
MRSSYKRNPRAPARQTAQVSTMQQRLCRNGRAGRTRGLMVAQVRRSVAKPLLTSAPSPLAFSVLGTQEFSNSHWNWGAAAICYLWRLCHSRLWSICLYELGHVARGSRVVQPRVRDGWNRLSHLYRRSYFSGVDGFRGNTSSSGMIRRFSTGGFLVQLGEGQFTDGTTRPVHRSADGRQFVFDNDSDSFQSPPARRPTLAEPGRTNRCSSLEA